MAILKNLIVNGSSRFLNTAYFQDVSIDSLSLSGNLSVTGTSTLTGHVSIGGYNNASYGLSASSAIINSWIRTTGSTGWYNESHGGGWYMTDNNYVRSYGKPVMMGHNLYFNSTSYYVNTSGAASFSSIASPSATINNATISGDLTVNGVLQANDFIKNIVKAVGGQLYVSPTFQALSSTTVTCTSVTATQLSLTLSDNAINGTDYAGATWYKDSKVMLSGTLTANTTGHTEEIIFSSVPGVVTANMSSSNKLQIKLDYDGASTYFKTGTLTTSDVAVMMYQINIPSGSTNAGLHPIGIYIKAYGTNNKNSYIDIFGGTSNTPNARLGLLNGLPNMQNGTQIKGWGIATTNGFFDGTIVSSSGKIGAFTLSSDLRSGTWGTSGSVLVAGGYTPTTADAKSIGGSPTTGNTWAFTAGNAFGVTTAGKIYASDAEISGKITANTGTIGGVTANSSYGLYTNSKTSATSTNTGFLISKDGAIYLGAYNSTNKACPFQVTSAGALTATSGKIGGWTLGADRLATESTNPYVLLAPGIGTNKDVFYVRTGSGTTADPYKWPIVMRANGYFYADNATITGNSIIGPWHVTTTSIYKGANTLGSTTSGAAYFGDLGLSVGNKFKVDASGDGAIILGELAPNKTHVEIDSDSFDVCSGATTGANSTKLMTIDPSGFNFGEENSGGDLIDDIQFGVSRSGIIFKNKLFDDYYKPEVFNINIADTELRQYTVTRMYQYAKSESDMQFDERKGNIYELGTFLKGITPQVYITYYKQNSDLSIVAENTELLDSSYYTYGFDEVYEDTDEESPQYGYKGPRAWVIFNSSGIAAVNSKLSAYSTAHNWPGNFGFYDIHFNVTTKDPPSAYLNMYGDINVKSRVYLEGENVREEGGNITCREIANENGTTLGAISHVGSIIMSTTLDTEDKVIALYGGDAWIQHSGYFLRGATSGVSDDSPIADAGADSVTLTAAQSGMPSHSHSTGDTAHPRWPVFTGTGSTETVGSISGEGYKMYQIASSGTWSNRSATNSASANASQAHTNLPRYKNVYIWERVL